MLHLCLIGTIECLGFYLAQVLGSHRAAAVAVLLPAEDEALPHFFGRGEEEEVEEQRVLAGEEGLPALDLVPAGLDPFVVQTVDEFVGDEDVLIRSDIIEEREEPLLAIAQIVLVDDRAVAEREEELEVAVDQALDAGVDVLLLEAEAHLGLLEVHDVDRFLEEVDLGVGKPAAFRRQELRHERGEAAPELRREEGAQTGSEAMVLRELEARRERVARPIGGGSSGHDLESAQCLVEAEESFGELCREHGGGEEWLLVGGFYNLGDLEERSGKVPGFERCGQADRGARSGLVADLACGAEGGGGDRVRRGESFDLDCQPGRPRGGVVAERRGDREARVGQRVLDGEGLALQGGEVTRDDPGDEVEQRRLASAVLAEEDVEGVVEDEMGTGRQVPVLFDLEGL